MIQKNQRAGYMVKQQSNYASFVPNPLPPKDMVLTAKTIKLLAEANRLNAAVHVLYRLFKNNLL
jgi:hypothetical protein